MADIKMNTPKGTAVFPSLARPDTKFDELGMYKADLSVPLQEAKDLMGKLTEVFKRHTGKAPNANENTMWYKQTDKDTGEETGNVVFKIRVKNRMTKSGQLWDRKPVLFDAALKPIQVNPWGGTEMIVSMSVYAWNAGGKMGVSLQPQAIQIINLVEGGTSSHGFEVTEGFDGSTVSAFEDDVIVPTSDDLADF
jgi:hypothetical protein